MHPQLAKVNVQLDEVSDLAQRLVNSILPDDMRLRPEPDHWSVAECLVHLNLSSESFVQLIRNARRQAHEKQISGTPPYKMDTMGRLLNWAMQPPARIQVRTSEKFQPNLIEPLDNVLSRFISLQEELKTEIANVDGLDLNRMIVQSPFSKRVRYNLYSCLVLIVTHQRRHLWQAENAKRAILRER
ncbi:MAG TPA: DinB family protein [Pyrinomonadaceae bacterium]|nr:DinB family protein [Pyrinomonadaceae bacterium]